MQTEPTLDNWRRLYDLAGEIKRLAPWRWMGEDDLFAVQDPDTGKTGFVSIMGRGGAVSYTHLDVYKRQPWGSLRRRA